MAYQYTAIAPHYQQQGVPFYGTPHRNHRASHSVPSIHLNGYPVQRPVPPAQHFAPAQFDPPPSLPARRKRRSGCDAATPLLLVVIWASLVLSGLSLLFVLGSDNVVSSKDVFWVIVTSFLVSLPATIANEMLIDRCWQRVSYAALGDPLHCRSDIQLADNLRASNFELLNFIGRITRREVSWKDFQSLFSYAFLRWGTTASIASVQLVASFDKWDGRKDDSGYGPNKQVVIHRRQLWLAAPALLHGLCIFCSLLTWGIMPSKLLTKIHEERLLERYRPYLDAVIDHGGSIASSQQVATFLARRGYHQVKLATRHKPGLQLREKIKGIWFGLLALEVPPVLAYLFMDYRSENGTSVGQPLLRFGIHLVVLIQNIFYLLALDFVIWNLSLEGLCKGKKTRLNHNLRHLLTTSGIMLFIKAIKQRRPRRSLTYLWLFWIQAVIFRALTTLFILLMACNQYEDQFAKLELFQPDFWIWWISLTGIIVYPLFLIWFLTPFQAPMCSFDGWRWATIAHQAVLKDDFVSGNYGVLNGKATWGPHVVSFSQWGDHTLA